MEHHRLLAGWAADCAEDVLPLFERACPDDARPRLAIKAARAWSRGEIAVGAAREAAFAAHAAARGTTDAAARAAARAAGHWKLCCGTERILSSVKRKNCCA